LDPLAGPDARMERAEPCRVAACTASYGLVQETGAQSLRCGSSKRSSGSSRRAWRILGCSVALVAAVGTAGWLGVIPAELCKWSSFAWLRPHDHSGVQVLTMQRDRVGRVPCAVDVKVAASVEPGVSQLWHRGNHSATTATTTSQPPVAASAERWVAPEPPAAPRFTPLDGGADRACRGPVSAFIPHLGVASLEECQVRCIASSICLAIEFGAAAQRCEVWTSGPLSSAYVPGFTCHRYHGPSGPQDPSRLCTAGSGGSAARRGGCSHEATVDDRVRVQALSPTLLRVEPQGPEGFEDRTTFMVVERDWPGIPIKAMLKVPGGTLLKTAFYSILVREGTTRPKHTCATPAESTDAVGGVRSVKFNNAVGAYAISREACCNLCEQDVTCTAWVYQPVNTPGSKNCWPLLSFASTMRREGSQFGFSSRAIYERPKFKVLAIDGSQLYDSEADQNPTPHLLHWPSPGTALSYALVDRARFFVPPWGPTPMPLDIVADPQLQATNGYDFRNAVDGDTYVFLLGMSSPEMLLEEWEASRKEFLRLTGPCPLLPDFAYGTWYSRWFHYTETIAKANLDQWDEDNLPIDVWGMDMNWRETNSNKDRFYNYPCHQCFANFTDWFLFLRRQGIRTYLNDHAFPVAMRDAGGLQTSPEEVQFRWDGLTSWMEKGAAFWWYDSNWRFALPVPMVNSSYHHSRWHGLSNIAWGSHVYYKITALYDKEVRDKSGNDWYGGRPITLTKAASPDWRSGYDSRGHAESPAHHRYPIWWTGDWQDLMGSVETMVDAGVHDLKPFVHSDCGGDHRYSGADLVRWVAHCAFGTILRIHGNDHRPWSYDSSIEDTLRAYIAVRYRLLPSLIAAGHLATRTGFPLVARGDLYWPDLAPQSATNSQYIFLDDLLVAPTPTHCLERSGKPCAEDGRGADPISRQVWIPPGHWQDAWDGTVVKGPRTIFVTRTFQYLPLWHRRDGSMLIICDQPTRGVTRVETQDWSLLTLEIFLPSTQPLLMLRRAVYERGSSVRTDLVLRSNSSGYARLEIGEGPVSRAWVARFHLLPGQYVDSALVDGQPALTHRSLHAHRSQQVAPSHRNANASFFPLSGRGTRPAPRAGPVAELHLHAMMSARAVDVRIRGTGFYNGAATAA